MLLNQYKYSTLKVIILQVGANNGLDGVLTMVATPSVFFNECEISFKFDWRSQAELPADVNVQVSCFIQVFWLRKAIVISFYGN